jgi:hypothetical protein
VSFAEHYKCILKATERRGAAMLRNQIIDPDSSNFGGFMNHSEGLVYPSSGPGSLLTLIPLFIHTDSSFFGSEELRQRIRMVFDFAERVQREDGTFDLLTTNFYSSPDNGFIMHNLVRTWKILETYSASQVNCPDCASLKDRLYKLIERTAAGMIRGGFHTPNHRWVIAAGLASAHAITGKEQLLTVAYQYLAEGIDCDENGEYTERSTGIYNAVNDNALIMLSDVLGDKELLDPVVRNLEMMFTYIEPDSTLFTWNSTRQDKGEGGVGAKFYLTPYYHLYLMMLTRKSDPRYAWLAGSIFQNLGRDNPPSTLWLYMLEPELQTLEMDAQPPASAYEKFYESSGVVRFRKDNLAITLMRDSSSFLFINTPELSGRMKLCASFFGKSQFKPEKLEKTGEGYRLTFKTSGDYRLPLDPPPESPIWEEMDHSRREHVRILDLELTVDILPRNDGVEIEVETAGCDRVPFKLEMIFDNGCLVTGESFVTQGGPGQSITATTGAVKVRKGGTALEIGPAFGVHNYTSAMRGSEPRNREGFTLYFTDFTPVRRRIKIRKTG